LILLSFADTQWEIAIRKMVGPSLPRGSTGHAVRVLRGYTDVSYLHISISSSTLSHGHAALPS